jgi:hypothetical protein
MKISGPSILFALFLEAGGALTERNNDDTWKTRPLSLRKRNESDIDSTTPNIHHCSIGSNNIGSNVPKNQKYDAHIVGGARRVPLLR